MYDIFMLILGPILEKFHNHNNKILASKWLSPNNLKYKRNLISRTSNSLFQHSVQTLFRTFSEQGPVPGKKRNLLADYSFKKPNRAEERAYCVVHVVNSGLSLANCVELSPKRRTFSGERGVLRDHGFHR